MWTCPRCDTSNVDVHPESVTCRGCRLSRSGWLTGQTQWEYPIGETITVSIKNGCTVVERSLGCVCGNPECDEADAETVLDLKGEHFRLTEADF